MRRRTTHRSLGWRVVASVLAGELTFALTLGLTIGVFSALNAAQMHREATEELASAVAAALMPMVADQQRSQVEAQLQGIVEATSLHAIECIHIVDSAGVTIASHGDRALCPWDAAEQLTDPWSMLTQSQVVRQPIAVDGLEVATVIVRFSPPALSDSLGTPVLASGLVLLSVMLVSVPWTVWLVVKEMTEPLQKIEGYASRIAAGDFDIAFDGRAAGEIGSLGLVLSRTAEQLREQRTELKSSYDALAGAYESLERAKAEIEELAAVKADFVAVAAHEIRTPLATIRLYAELLDTGEVSDLDSEGAEAVAAIYSAATRLGSIASDLMDSALLERGLLPLEFGDVGMRELVTNAVRDADAAARVRDMVVRAEMGSRDATVRGDSLRLRQVLDNLLSNAIKYSPEGSEVLVRLTEDEAWVTTDVVDRGRGIALGDRTRLFTLFGRIDFGDSRETAGLGLGLAISARIVEAHGGTIAFRANDEGRGSIFSVRLPRLGHAAMPTMGTTVNVVRRGK